MNPNKLTELFLMKIEPVREGVYMVYVDMGRCEGNRFYSYWDGKGWRGAWYSIDRAWVNRDWGGVDKDFIGWRGLTKETLLEELEDPDGKLASGAKELLQRYIKEKQ